ncbi:tRNA pseudouridine synthase B [Clostridia bacterium]|nr:tRNA pseudouridine synthase B [Clostridia bacterium]
MRISDSNSNSTNNEITGIINFLKPSGMTSHDAVSFLRRISGIKRIGHTGSLDPMAVGVLPLCIGTATRITEYLTADEKSYRCEMKLGLSTDTQDIWGTVLSKAETGTVELLTKEAILKAIDIFTGRQLQIPPAYSAVKIKGKKLYEYARAGENVTAKAREVNIKSIMVNHIDLATGLVLMDVDCSKGTYIRTLCNDIGDMLGCGAVMNALVRTGSGYFKLEDAVTAEELEKADIEDVLISTDVPLCGFESQNLPLEEAGKFINGLAVNLVNLAVNPAKSGENFFRVYTHVVGGSTDERNGLQNVFLGIGQLRDGFLKADKVLITDEMREIIYCPRERKHETENDRI